METIAIRRKLQRWFTRHRRDLPWRCNADPYRIWISEVMLQQTRVAAVIPYYSRFLARFPTVSDLARARPQAVLRAWTGLGYYARARNLHWAARRIRDAGSFPASYAEWLELPGVGRYTAAAIASIALGEPRAVVDGNVRRVLSRLLALHGGHEAKAEALLDRRRPGDFNQGMMELGATICLPAAPHCPQCPLAAECVARRENRIAQFPAARPRTRPRRLTLKLAMVQRAGRLLLARPAGKGLWPSFWTLPQLPHPKLQAATRLSEFRHAVTFRDFRVEVFQAQLGPDNGLPCPAGMRWVTRAEVARLPVSTPSRKALQVLAR